jgi:hypothetical protein
LIIIFFANFEIFFLYAPSKSPPPLIDPQNPPPCNLIKHQKKIKVPPDPPLPPLQYAVPLKKKKAKKKIPKKKEKKSKKKNALKIPFPQKRKKNQNPPQRCKNPSSPLPQK